MALKAFGLDSVIDKGANEIRKRVGDGVSGVVNRGIRRATDAINKPFGGLGISLGSDLDPNSWFSKASSRNDPHLEYEWDIEMPFGLGSEYIEEVSSPVYEYETSPGIFRGGVNYFYADIRATSSLSITMYEDNKYTSTTYLENWRRLIATPTGLYNYPSKYKKKIVVKAVDVKGNLIAKFTYSGCWPTKQDNYNYVSDGSGRIRLRQDFLVDDMSVEVLNSPSSGVALGELGKIEEFIRGVPTKIATGIASGVGTIISDKIGRIF